MELKEAESVIERYQNNEMVYEQEYIDALETVNEHLTKQVVYWKSEALTVRASLK